MPTGDIETLSPSSHYFLREEGDGVREALEGADWSDVVGRTPGIRSLSNGEIAFRLGGIFG